MERELAELEMMEVFEECGMNEDPYPLFLNGGSTHDAEREDTSDKKR